MGVYIPWMSMPRTCDDCQVSADCPNDEHIDGYNMQNRPRFCQLVPVPEHGDLIDRDALPWENQGFMLTDPNEWGLKATDIENAPTIIPADKEEP